jgi:hypothetical protein
VSRQVELVTIFLASPSDLTAERAAVRQVAAELNRTWSRRMGVYFEVVGWEEVPSGIGSDPQDVVNRYIEGEYDVFLGLMGATLGSPTGRAASGTVEEYDRARNRYREDPAAVELMFYFKDDDALSKEGRIREPAVDEFRATLQTSILYRTFTDALTLTDILRHELGITMQLWSSRRLAVQEKVEGERN